MIHVRKQNKKFFLNSKRILDTIANFSFIKLIFSDPWVGGGRKKKKSPKHKPKKRQTTQDKIKDIISKKLTTNKANGKEELTYPAPPRDAIERACNMKEELLEQIERIGERLPPNTLDQLIDELGGPENVAEVIFYY